jgi:hypothetical protein
MTTTKAARGIQSEAELAITRRKLARVESLYNQVANDESKNPRIADLARQSLMDTINQLKEEISTYESQQRSR